MDPTDRSMEDSGAKSNVSNDSPAHFQRAGYE